MDIEQTMKDLQAQNSQFQETLVTLARGKQELMTMLAAKKKTKKKAFTNMRKRIKGSIRQVQIVEESSEEDENKDKEARSTRDGGANNQASEDEDYFDE